MPLSRLRTGLLTLTLVLGTLLLLAAGLFYRLASPRTWTSTHPQQPDLSVRIEVQNLGLVDDHDQTDVFLCYSPWFGLNSETMIGRFDSYGGYDGGGPYGALTFTFDWHSADSLYIFATLPSERNAFTGTLEPRRRLVTIVLPSQHRAMKATELEQIRQFTK